jgi:hypothetical protein
MEFASIATNLAMAAKVQETLYLMMDVYNVTMLLFTQTLQFRSALKKMQHVQVIKNI